jgi:hypothetical protein
MRPIARTRRRAGGACSILVLLLNGASIATALAQEPDLSTEDVSGFEDGFDFSLPPPSASAPAGKLDASRFTVLPKVPSGWDAKAGLDYRTPAAPGAAFRPDLVLPGAPQDQSAGIAWANVTAPGLTTPWGWDKAAFDSRIDPEQDGKLGVMLSRSLPVGGDLALTLQNGYSMTRTLGHGIAPSEPGLMAFPAAPGLGSPEHVFETNEAVRFSIVPLDATLSVGAAFSNADDKWSRSLSAEQKLFGGPVSVTGTVSEGADGEISKSLKAGFKHKW